MSDGLNIAVVGATGLVGREILSILEERKFPVNKVFALASKNSVGKKISMSIEKQVEVEAFDKFNFKDNNIDIAFFCAGESISKEYAEEVAKTGCIVIDKSSYFRLNNDVPLIVPEVNIGALKNYTRKNIIATPNCTTIPFVLCAKPLDEEYKIKRVVITTFQSVSGSGADAVDELYNQTKGFFEASVQNLEPELKGKIYPKQIAFNCIPQCDSFDTNGNTKEENKIINETEKILGKKIPISSTCVRVPVFRCHAESINFEFEKKIEIDDVIELLDNAPSVAVYNRERDGGYAVQCESCGTDCVYVSRIRKDDSVKNGLNIWLACDNIRKGSALNGVQIAEEIIKM